MKQEISDSQIRSRTRSVLVRHWLDMQRIALSCSRGRIRIRGELQPFGDRSRDPIDAHKIEQLEHDLKTVRGVVSVQFELENWTKLESGTWRTIGAARRKKQPEPDAEPEREPSPDAEPGT